MAEQRTLTYVRPKPGSRRVRLLVTFAGSAEDEILGRDVMLWRGVNARTLYCIDAPGNVHRIKGRERLHVGRDAAIT